MLFKLFIIIVLVQVWGKQISTKKETHIEIEVGQSFSSTIPIIFVNFQHSQLQELKRETENYEAPICQIRLAENGLLRETSAIRYNQFNLTSMRDRIIDDISELKNLRIFIDAVWFKERIVSFFATSEVVYYSITQTGAIKEQKIVKIQGNFSNFDAQFLNVGQDLLLFSSERVIKLTERGIQQVLGLQSLNQHVYDIQSIGDQIYIAGGAKGLLIYKYDSNTQLLRLLSNTTFILSDSGLVVQFDANQIEIDRLGDQVYILDSEEGLLNVRLSQIKNSTLVNQSKAVVLVTGCQNLALSSFQIFMTCPELLQINRQNRAVERTIRNSFNPQHLFLINQRIYLLGHQQFAIYDLSGKSLSEFTLKIIAQKSLLINNFLVLFSNSEVISSSIISQRQSLYCYTQDLGRVGEYRGNYKSVGLCKDFFESPQQNFEICQVLYPFVLIIKNSAIESLLLEIGLLIGYLAVSFTVALFFTIKHYLVRRNYSQLVEEESKQEKIEVSSHIQMAKKSSQEEVR